MLLRAIAPTLLIHEGSAQDLLILIARLLTIIAKFLRPGGAKSIVADSLLIKQQLQIINRSRQRTLFLGDARENRKPLR